jgi:thiol-disulfide isomerase/thioredoxin
MQRRFLMVILMLAAVLVGCNGGDDAAVETIQAGPGVPMDLNGENFSLASYEGEVVILDFWATWCPPCKRAMPHLQEIHEEHDSQGIHVVAVATDQQGAEIVGPFIEKNGYTFRVVPDAAQVISRQFGSIRSIPTTFIIGPDGKVKNKFVGYQDKKVYLDAALAAKGS